MFKVIPSLWGSIATDAVTACGNSVDTRGFRGVLATLICGASASSSGASAMALTVKIQEAETLGAVGASWTDITDGVINGSFKLSECSLTASGPTLYMSDMYERLDRPNAKRYIRAHIEGTSANAGASLGVRFSVNLILCDPVDTLYCVQPTSYATTNADFTYNVG